MHLPRRLVTPPLVVAFVCATIASTVFAARDLPSASSQSERKPFTHAKHVPFAWYDPTVVERQRDCRGCHDYGRSETRDPQVVCTQCHFTDDTNRYEFSLEVKDESFRTGLESLRTAGSLFQHYNHLALECRECHTDGSSRIEAPILMPKTGGLELCQQCHVGQKPRQAALQFMSTRRDGTPITEEYKQAARAKLPLSLVASLNGAAAMGPNGPGQRNVGPFRHADHFQLSAAPALHSLADLASVAPSAQASRTGNCAACHGPMFDAQAGMGGEDQHVPFVQAEESCGTCHIADAARTPLQFAFEHTLRPGRTAATFSHSVHLNMERPTGRLSKSSDAGYAAIETQGCNACHGPDFAGPQDFAFKRALDGEHSFQGCQTCHDTSVWAPTEHGAWWTHEDHGSWQSCTPCHDFLNGSFADDRVLAEVERATVTHFQIESHKHPHISVADGRAIEDSCAECHRQPVEELPSRIREARFQHTTHLPPNAGPEACVSCHGAAVSGAETSAAVGLPAASGPLVTYDASACSTCHLGSAPVPVTVSSGSAAGRPARSWVPEFSHAGHVGKLLTDGTAVGCTTCHDAGTRGALEVGTLESAQDCSMCHGHAAPAPPEAARAPSTGHGITAAEVAACALCHVGGLPVPGAAIDWPSARIVDLVGDAGQFHPSAGVQAGQGGESICADCHMEGERLISAAAGPSHSRVFAVRGFYEEAQTRTLTPAIHRGETRKTTFNVNCFVCHWTNTLSGSVAKGGPPTNPESVYVRRQKGDDLSSYPGGPSAQSSR